MGLVLLGELNDGRLDSFGGFNKIPVCSVDGHYPVAQFTVRSFYRVDPQSESCEVGRDAWNMERHAFCRGVAPWLIISLK